MLNTDLLAALREHRLQAVGLSGVDADLITAHAPAAGERGGRRRQDRARWTTATSATSSGWTRACCSTLMEARFVPVVASLAGDDEGNVYNVNADTVAESIAVALQAMKLIFMTGAPGVLRDRNDPSSLVTFADPDDLAEPHGERRARGRHAPQGGGVHPRRDERGGAHPHHRRPRARRAAARGVHRRRLRHHDRRAGRRRRPTLASTWPAEVDAAPGARRDPLGERREERPWPLLRGDGARLGARRGERRDRREGGAARAASRARRSRSSPTSTWCRRATGGRAIRGRRRSRATGSTAAARATPRRRWPRCCARRTTSRDAGGPARGRLLVILGLGEETKHTSMPRRARVGGRRWTRRSWASRPTCSSSVAQRGLMMVDLVARGDQRHAGYAAEGELHQRGRRAGARPRQARRALPGAGAPGAGPRHHHADDARGRHQPQRHAARGEGGARHPQHAELDARGDRPDARARRSSRRWWSPPTRLVPCETPAHSRLLAARPAGAAGRRAPTAARPAPTGCSCDDRDAIKCGPGTSRRSHTADECVDLPEVTEARAFYGARGAGVPAVRAERRRERQAATLWSSAALARRADAAVHRGRRPRVGRAAPALGHPRQPRATSRGCGARAAQRARAPPRCRGALRRALGAADARRARRSAPSTRTSTRRWSSGSPRRLGALGERVHTGPVAQRPGRGGPAALPQGPRARPARAGHWNWRTRCSPSRARTARRSGRATPTSGARCRRRPGCGRRATPRGCSTRIETLDGLWPRLDRSPLGSAAGYGVPLPLDREAAARALGFARHRPQRDRRAERARQARGRGAASGAPSWGTTSPSSRRT